MGKKRFDGGLSNESFVQRSIDEEPWDMKFDEDEDSRWELETTCWGRKTGVAGHSESRQATYRWMEGPSDP